MSAKPDRRVVPSRYPHGPDALSAPGSCRVPGVIVDRLTLTMAQFDRLSLVDREAVNAWCRANRLDGTISVRLLEPTGRKVQLTRYLRDDTGSRYLAAKGTPATATETLTLPVAFPVHVLDVVHAA